MKFNDILLLIKKILVGVAIFLVPFTIIFGGLYFTQHWLEKPNAKTATSIPNQTPEKP